MNITIMSRNLLHLPTSVNSHQDTVSHVLFNELKDFTDDEKADMADDFAEEYEGKVEDFIEFISQEDLIAPGTFKQTWRFIEKEKHSLERFTNMHLIFK